MVSQDDFEGLSNGKVERLAREMTVREHFAAMAMQGMIQHLDKYPLPFDEQIAKDAVQLSDALIKALSQESGAE